MKINNLTVLGGTDGEFYDKRFNRISVTGEFAGKLREIEQANVYSYLSDLMLDIEKQGMRLGDTLSINELRYYKKMISEFLQQAIHAACLFEKENISDRRGRRQIYAIIKKVNQKVDDLVLQFMAEEKNNIDIIKMIDDIRGILLDILM